MNSNIIKKGDSKVNPYRSKDKIKVSFDDSRGNPLAVVAFVFSVLGFVLLPIVGTVVGMVCGYIARNRSNYNDKRGGFLAGTAILFSWIQATIILCVGGIYLLTFGVSLLFTPR